MQLKVAEISDIDDILELHYKRVLQRLVVLLLISACYAANPVGACRSEDFVCNISMLNRFLVITTFSCKLH